MSFQDQCSTNWVKKSGGNTENKSQPCNTEQNVSWQITGTAKMNALKESRDRYRPKTVNKKFKQTFISNVQEFLQHQEDVIIPKWQNHKEHSFYKKNEKYVENRQKWLIHCIIYLLHGKIGLFDI